MLIGILSDSHGHSRRVRAALELFDRLGVQQVIHCGDVGGIEVLDQFVGRTVQFVWGNTDQPDAGLRTYLKSVGLTAPSAVPLELNLAGKRILVFHGHERGFEAALASAAADYLLHGHTHQRRDERIGRMRVINPGALHRAIPRSVATLDLTSDTLTFHEIPRS
ncbi:MAG TPA: metallophosphoesterase family protein [Phycisphaerae bacterium]|jgi:hypothetical protein